MDRQQAIGLLLEPRLSLFMLAVRTVPIAARASHPVLTLTAVAGEDDVPQLSGATACDRTEHLALLERDWCCDRSPDRVTLLKKRVAMLP